MKSCSYWMIIPITVSVLAAVGFIVVYELALVNKKICRIDSFEKKRMCKLRPPFISVAGDSPPESCIFSQIMNMTAFLVTIIGVLRYSQLKVKVKQPWLNILGLISTFLSSFGMTLVANFQLSNNTVTHNVGALITFGFAILTCWIQTSLTFEVKINKEARFLGIIRFLLSAVITLTFIVYLVLAAQRSFFSSAKTQWALALCVLFYLGTFALDFRYYDFEVLAREKYPRKFELRQKATDVSVSIR
ncbi:transmembrane protein 150C isoform X1 [Leucoraja erinacea]|uniref:transmembrane protein 150C isoform X1 n=1 Tax=Leucoraja erinaceus TaxID=7782 RepID=UPI0024568137|nr:transmembrane protein 150C isoform X1 [Leucoraja erinacea]XP_055495228.1 transmembrane protein 150C isoform X1 [Leucoraja erinacea]XP_055495233.1 transmembrane protein 150C isoform X1 [Leucoraja erinacea]XP_055495241.1 transmembrane protein 150C isoform X1 [Leucoraja erinacea]